MGRQLFVGLCLAALFGFVALPNWCLLEGVQASAEFPVHNLVTGLNYSSIQGAIDAPETADGHTITVEAGTYCEQVVVHKAVALVAEIGANATVDGNGTGTVLHVLRNATTITGFRVRASGGYPSAGILLEQVQACNISANVVDTFNGTRVDAVAIGLNGSYGNTVVGNVVQDHLIALNVYASSDNRIAGNQLVNAHLGIQVAHSASRNIIAGNDLVNCDYGISLDHGSQDNEVAQNSIEGSRDVGVAIETTSSNNTVVANTIRNSLHGFRLLWAVHNRIYHNNILNTTVPAYVTRGYPNTWDHGYPAGGNYWSNTGGIDFYRGVAQNETGSDGITDGPRMIDADNVDQYPLVGLFAAFEVFLYPYPTAGAEHVEVISNSSVECRGLWTWLSSPTPYLQPGQAFLWFNASGDAGTVGFFRTMVPRTVLNGSSYTVLVDWTPVPVTELPGTNTTHAYLYFTFTHSFHDIVIIPELHALLLLPLLLVGASLVTRAFMRKREG